MTYELGTVLRRRREERRISRQLLHERADVSTTYISQIELGEDPRTKLPPQASPETLRKLARGLEPEDEGSANRLYEELMAVAGYLPEAAAPALFPSLPFAAAPPLAARGHRTGEARSALNLMLEVPDERLRRHLPAVLAAWERLEEAERTALVTVLRWLDDKYALTGKEDAASGGRSGPDV